MGPTSVSHLLIAGLGYTWGDRIHGSYVDLLRESAG